MPNPGVALAGLQASGRTPPCYRNPFILLRSHMPKSLLCVNPVPALVSVGEMGQSTGKLIKW